MKTVCSRKYISAARKWGIANKKIALKKYEEQLNTTEVVSLLIKNGHGSGVAQVKMFQTLGSP